MIRLLTWVFSGRGNSAGESSEAKLLEKIRHMEELLHQKDGANSNDAQHKPQQEEVIEPTDCFQKTGRVTAVKGDLIIIDGLYFVPKTMLKNCAASERVEQNTRLSFLAYRKLDAASGESTVKVIKILSVIDEMWTEGGLASGEPDWEHASDKHATTRATPGTGTTVYYKGNQRREPGKVIGKEHDTVTIETDAGDPLTVDMDKTRMSFVPVLGDYVTLDCLVQMDEEFVDFKGEVLEVVAIEPSRTVSGSGKITTIGEGGGEILTRTGKFVYQSEFVAESYRPTVGDMVSFQAIENEVVQMRCMNVKLIEASSSMKNPGNRSTTAEQNRSNQAPRLNEGSQRDTQLWDDKQGIRIIGDFDVKLTKLEETIVRTVTVKNESNNRHRILQITLMKKTAKQQVCLKSPAAFSQIVLFPGETADYVFEITGGDFYGRHRESWIWKFAGNFQIGRTFNVSIEGLIVGDAATGSEWDGASSTKPCNTKLRLLQQKLAALNMRREQGSGRIIAGQHISKRPNFIAFNIPMYTVPPDLFELLLTTSNTGEIKDALGKSPYCLDEPLSVRNYARIFDHYIFLEEINQYIEFRKHDIERGHFTREDNYLALHVQNILESRPSVMIGDSVYATAPWSHEDGKDVPSYQGFIYKVLQNRVLLKFDANFQASYNGESYRITFSFGRGSYRKQHHAIDRMKTIMGMDYLFPEAIEPRQAYLNVRLNDRDELVSMNDDGTRDRVLPWYNGKLNRYQKFAIANVLRSEARPLPYIIFGPPGTGKTITTIELIHQLAKNSPDCRLVVATPSNSAAYLITERLASGGVLKPGDFIRLVGLNQVERETIPEHLAQYCATVDVADDRNRCENQVLTTESGLRMKLQAKHIGLHRVTISTCTCIGTLMQLRFPRNHFTHVIIDEAGQSLEPETLIPITLINRTVGSVTLVGDPKQLGPVVLSYEAANRGFGISLIERLLTTARPYGIDRGRFPDTHGYDPRLVTKLCINYRSIPSLLSLYSDLFYDSQLEAERKTHSVEDSALLTTIHEILEVKRPTADYGFFFCGIDGTNKQAPDSPSWFSPAEASMVHKIVEKLYRKGYQASEIGIITPYVMQVKIIRRIFDVASLDAPKVGSVEEFQGQERKIMILSTVRSSRAQLPQDKGAVLGFVAAPKRVNVALSRAKVVLIVVGNPKLLAIDRIWLQVLQRAVNHETYVGCSWHAVQTRATDASDTS